MGGASSCLAAISLTTVFISATRKSPIGNAPTADEAFEACARNGSLRSARPDIPSQPIAMEYSIIELQGERETMPSSGKLLTPSESSTHGCSSQVSTKQLK